jgi:catechol 2,3-dioxygenase-like lactoylglutathione lyase family enzyme
MSGDWFARPVLFVADVERALDFYVGRLGFTRSWEYAEDARVVVAQAERPGCALIVSSQWPDKVGKGRVFVSLDAGGPAALVEALNQLRAELEGKGVAVEDGSWGYRVLIVRDPDGNELYFSYPRPDEGQPTS